MGATDDYQREDDDENEFRRARDAAVQEQERMHALNQADAESKAGPSSSAPETGAELATFAVHNARDFSTLLHALSQAHAHINDKHGNNGPLPSNRPTVSPRQGLLAARQQQVQC